MSSVKVHIYDLSKGMARAMSMPFLGKQIDGIWHTGIVVYNEEFFYGGMGIETCAPSTLFIGPPDEVVEVGQTEIPKEMFMEFLEQLGNSTYKPSSYHLLDHNCNNFSDEVAQFLTGKGIPSHIVALPHEVMTTPFGPMLRNMMDQMQVNPGGHQLFPGSS